MRRASDDEDPRDVFRANSVCHRRSWSSRASPGQFSDRNGLRATEAGFSRNHLTPHSRRPPSGLRPRAADRYRGSLRVLSVGSITLVVPSHTANHELHLTTPSEWIGGCDRQSSPLIRSCIFSKTTAPPSSTLLLRRQDIR